MTAVFNAIMDDACVVRAASPLLAGRVRLAQEDGGACCTTIVRGPGLQPLWNWRERPRCILACWNTVVGQQGIS